MLTAFSSLGLRIGLGLVLLSGSIALFGAEKGEKKAPQGFFDIESPQAASILGRFANFVILDIRTPKEFEAGHLKRAKNIDYFADDFARKIDKLDRNQAYLVHCASGGRSGRSMTVFKEKGFTTIYHLADGYKGWVAAKQPVVKQ